MPKLRVDEHALKHGLEQEDILHAWTHRIVVKYRDAPCEGEILAIGADAAGRLMQIVAIEDHAGILIYHAMSPPTRKVLHELGL